MTYEQSAATGNVAVAAPPSDDTQLDTLFAKVTRRLIPFLLVCYVGAYLDRVNISFAKLQMSSDLGFSDAVYGAGAGIFFLGYFLFEVPSNILLHRIGARVWITRIMVTWSLLSAAMVFVQTATGFYVLRFLLGVAEAGFFPGIILLISRWYPSDRRGKVFALFMTAFPLASIIGGPLSGWAMTGLNGIFGLAGWKWLFVVEATPSLILGIAAFFYLSDRLVEAHWLSAQEKDLLRAVLANEQADNRHTSVIGTLSSPRIWHLSAILFCFGLGTYGLVFWLPTLIKLSGVSDPLHIGLLSAIPNILGAVSMILLGRSADRLRERRRHLTGAAVFGAFGLAAAACWPHQAFFAMVAICIAAIGVYPLGPLFWEIPTRLLSGVGAAAGLAMINSIANLAGFVGPAFFGWVKDITHSTAIGLLAFSSMLCLGALLVLILPRDVVSR